MEEQEKIRRIVAEAIQETLEKKFKKTGKTGTHDPFAG